jgi:hypothetical protein
MQRLAPKLWAETQDLLASHKATIEELTPKLLATGVLAGEDLKAALTEVGLIAAPTTEERAAGSLAERDDSA